MIGWILAVIFFWTLVKIPKPIKGLNDHFFTSSQLFSARTHRSLWRQINRLRLSKNLSFLTYDFELAKNAWSRVMDLEGKPLTHNGWLKKMGDRKVYGEILARGFGSNTGKIMKALVSSTRHYGVITRFGFKYVGIASNKNTVVAIFST